MGVVRMIVNIEFLDEDLIENVITSLHYRIDKMLFFGYEDIVKEQSTNMEMFLKQICDVKEIDFCIVDRYDLGLTVDTIYEKVEAEIAAGNQVFFDLTGGESLPLVAFGMLSKELNAPMHKYNVYTNELYEYGYEDTMRISEVAEYEPIQLNLDTYILMYGGKINGRLRKDFKNTCSQQDVKDIEDMWKLYKKYRSKWMYYSNFLRQFPPQQGLLVAENTEDFVATFRKVPQIGKIKDFNLFLEDCYKAGFFTGLAYKNGFYRYEYKNGTVKNYFWDGGSILEMHTFLEESKREEIADCRVGVHIDWDGVIHDSVNSDVLNEIDIMSIEGNMPTFISCKSGKVDQMALYELSTIANKFGGKYVKKVLVISKEISEVHLLRAKEMGIEVRNVCESEQ
jgi:hypothetical protein